MPAIENQIYIGKIVKSIGLKGHVKIILLTDFPDRFLKGKIIALFDEKNNCLISNAFSGGKDFTINDVGINNDFLKVRFEGYETRELADSLKDFYVCINESVRMELKDGKHYLYDLVDAEVVENGVTIGTVKSIENYGGDDLLKVKLRSNGKEVFIPLRKEFVINIDSVGKIIEVQLIDGFCE